ncbi:hypothetical protein LZ023_21260 [Pseudomonas silvicola]|nr:hypothetical protein LZ023_21260 [Pseudomonas silvicola]
MTTSASLPFPHLDPDFGVDGELWITKLMEDTPGLEHVGYVRALLPLSDGSILLAADAYLGSAGTGGYLLKLTSAGKLDDTFGQNKGYIQDDVTGDGNDYYHGVPYAVSLVGDRLLLSWLILDLNGNQYLLGCTAYDGDGNRDTSFSDDGKLILNFPPLAALPSDKDSPPPADPLIGAWETRENKIILFYKHQQINGPRSHTYLIKLNHDGSYDKDFHGDGYTEIRIGSEPVDFTTRVPLSNDRWVISGKRLGKVILAMIDEQGNPVSDFGDDGMTVIDKGVGTQIRGVLVTAAQRIIAVGNFGTQVQEPPAEGIILGYTATGQLDSTFTATQKSFLPDPFRFRSIVATPTAGELWVSGEVIAIHNYQAVLARFLPDGRPDTSFGDEGYLLFPGANNVPAIAIQNDGKCLMVADHIVDGAARPVLRRFLP